MRKLFLFGISSVLAAAPILSQAATQAPSPAALWQKVQALQKSHALMLGSKAYQPGSRTVDAYTIDLANQAENDAVRKAGSIEKVRRYPNGALVVKENFNEQRKLTGVTAMLKLDGYDPADRNWVMAAYSPAGKVVAYGKVPACIACHTMVRKQDFVFAPPPDQLLPVSVWKAFFPKQDIAPVYAQLLRSHADAVVK
ncbi:MAG: cytochrome P460 family protein [Gammaproteobacteria bacterium]|nr:cytochrome P460 family protein [Gammaproteobacteria bacterium]